MTFRCLLTVLAFSITGACLSDTSQQTLEEFLAASLEKHRVAGASVAVIEDGKVTRLGAAGIAAKDTPMTPQTVMQVASVSKPVAAWVAMHLVEAGLIELDEPISRYLTRWKIPKNKFDVEGVTLRRLLSHTAGLSLGGYPGFPPDFERPTIEASLSGQTNGAGAVFLTTEPGGSWSYSGGGYTLMQLLVEEVSGLTFADYARRHVLLPLGMKNSDYQPSTELLARAASAHGNRLNELANFRFTAEAAAGLHTTAEDLAKFVIANLSGTSVLNAETIAAMHSPSPASDYYGLGFGLSSDGATVGHSGANIGWKALMTFVPAENAGLVVLTNSQSGDQVAEDLRCFWSQQQAISHYRSMCDARKQAQEKEGYQLLAAKIFLGLISIIIVTLALYRLAFKPEYRLGLPPIKSWRILELPAFLLTALLMAGFFYTTAGAQLMAGIPGLYAIDFVSPQYVQLPPLFVSLLLAVGLSSLVRKP